MSVIVETLTSILAHNTSPLALLSLMEMENAFSASYATSDGNENAVGCSAGRRPGEKDNTGLHEFANKPLDAARNKIGDLRLPFRPQ